MHCIWTSNSHFTIFLLNGALVLCLLYRFSNKLCCRSLLWLVWYYLRELSLLWARTTWYVVILSWLGDSHEILFSVNLDSFIELSFTFIVGNTLDSSAFLRLNSNIRRLAILHIRHARLILCECLLGILVQIKLFRFDEESVKLLLMLPRLGLIIEEATACHLLSTWRLLNCFTKWSLVCHEYVVSHIWRHLWVYTLLHFMLKIKVIFCQWTVRSWSTLSDTISMHVSLC